MPSVTLDPPRRRRALVTIVYVVVFSLWALSAARKHNEAVQRSDFARAEHALPLVEDTKSPAESNALSFPDPELKALLAQRSPQSDADLDSDDNNSDGNRDEDQGSNDGADPNETWSKQVARGCQLVEMMETPDEELEADQKTPWHDYNQLAHYGWEYSDQDPTGDLGAHPNADEQKDSINSALDALGIPRIPSQPNDASGGWQKVAWIHSRSVTVNGRSYPATQAYIINYYNPGFGIIIAANTKSPAKMSPHVPRDQLVPLGQWSDITALTWQDMCQLHSQNPNTLRYIMRINVAGDVAGDILPDVIGHGLDELGSYDHAVTVPGMPDSDEARAAIGFPNGRGVGYLLVQHKDIFGDTRTIRDIKVWNSNNGVNEKMAFFNEVPNMLYTFS